ncbi:thioredoxin [Rhodophyticola sp. SM2404]
MLEFGQAQDSAAADLIKDTTDQAFMQDVVETSREVPVIVDFWAPWCGPCKTLGPQLEAAVTAARGKVRMVKINVDENPAIAGQLQVQSIPTVYAFSQGQPVDGFQGAVSQGDVQRFVEKIAALGGDGGLGEALEAAEEMLAQGAVDDAAQTFAAIVGEEPENAAANGGLARAHIALGDLDTAEALLNNVAPSIANAPEIEVARAQIELARQAADAGPLAELHAAVEANADDHQARFDYAQALHAAGNAEDAVEQLLELFRRDREWNDAAAKTQLFTIFDALTATDPIAQKGRRRLSSMIFA